MDSLKSFDIQLTDIWIECQKELIEMKNKIFDFKNCLKSSEQINKHLIKCNESLLSIIKKCKIDEQNNKKLNVLIEIIKNEEQCIEAEKQNLIIFKNKINGNSSDNKVLGLISEWKDCKPPILQTKDKSTQCLIELKSIMTQTLENKENINFNEINSNGVESDPPLVGNEDNLCDIRTVNIDLSDGLEPFEDLNYEDNKSDISVKSEGFDVNDMSDGSDYEPIEDHSKKKQKIKDNDFCGESSRTRRINAVVMPYKVDDRYVCTECDFSCGQKRGFFTHINSHRKRTPIKSEKKYLCEEENCDFKTNHSILLMRHTKCKHKKQMSDRKEGDIVGNGVDPNEGVDCDDYYSNILLKSKNIDDCNGFQSIEPKKKIRKTPEDIDDYWGESAKTRRLNAVVMPYRVDDTYICTACDYSCRVKRQFHKHINSHRGNKPIDYKSGDDINETDGKYMCKEENCDFKTNNSSRLWRHSKLIHKKEGLGEKQRLINEKISPFKVENGYNCSMNECEFKTCIKRVFYSHLLEHEGVKRRTSKETKSNDSERPYVCEFPECGMAFKVGEHLKMHRKRHLGERNIVCDWPGCGFRMYTSHNYMTHRRTHTNERPLKCEWPGCQYSCNQKWALVSHKRTHTGEKPYLCPFPECGYRCSQPCTLITHKRKHTGEKPYVCEIKGCSKRFSSLAGIWSHKKTHLRQLSKDTQKPMNFKLHK